MSSGTSRILLDDNQFIEMDNKPFDDIYANLWWKPLVADFDAMRAFCLDWRDKQPSWADYYITHLIMGAYSGAFDSMIQIVQTKIASTPTEDLKTNPGKLEDKKTPWDDWKAKYLKPTLVIGGLGIGALIIYAFIEKT